MHYQLLLVAIIGSSVALPVSGEYPTGRNVVISSLTFVLDLGIMSTKTACRCRWRHSARQLLPANPFIQPLEASRCRPRHRPSSSVRSSDCGPRIASSPATKREEAAGDVALENYYERQHQSDTANKRSKETADTALGNHYEHQCPRTLRISEKSRWRM